MRRKWKQKRPRKIDTYLEMHNGDGTMRVLSNQPPLVAANVSCVEELRPGIILELNLSGHRCRPIRHIVAFLVDWLVGVAPSAFLSACCTTAMRLLDEIAAARL